jgi:hypothetical protein
MSMHVWLPIRCKPLFESEIGLEHTKDAFEASPSVKSLGCNWVPAQTVFFFECCL